MESHPDRFCHDLPTQPVAGQKILVTGATGYIGSELVPELLARGYQVRVMVRTFSRKYEEWWPGVEVAVADACDFAALKNALKGIDCAYYLLHSLHLGKETFLELDNRMAATFRRAAEENGLKRIIYLSGLGNPSVSLSEHLLSRNMVAGELCKGDIPVTILRAAVIIGSGSASYKIVKYLVRNCPVFLLPPATDSRCQPIAIRDVIKYLVGCLESEETAGNTYDIGGQTILTYKNMLEEQAEVTGRKRLFIPAFFTTVKSCAFVASLLTPVPYKLIKSLMDSCSCDVICHDETIKTKIPFQPLSYREALTRALTRESKNVDAERNIFWPFGAKTVRTKSDGPATKSNGLFSDIRYFLLHRPKIPTLIKFNSQAERENYSLRILQRLAIGVAQYKILNIHKIEVDAPAKYVFEELLKWNGDSTCWPNHIAQVSRQQQQLEHLNIYLFGWKKQPTWLKNGLFGLKYVPLFKLDAINLLKTPDTIDSDNARYLLYKCSGGYPIGVFTMYVRSSIEQLQENGQCQLFLMVGFNFYGKKNWSQLKLINRTWELIHNRVTSNVLNRIKQLSEWRFEKIKQG